MMQSPLFYVAVALVVAAVLLVRRALKPKAFPACTEHHWRSIAQPYARQCRKCGRVEFREGPNGEFPEGFREYFDYIDYLKKERLL